jgi:hypothetical protein
MKLYHVALVLWAFCTVVVSAEKAISTTPVTETLSPDRIVTFDADPEHLWNRIHQALWVRHDDQGLAEYGYDVIEPLIWENSTHLSERAGFERALALLDEFNQFDGASLSGGPLKRAIFQHDLWAISDCLANLDRDPKGKRDIREIQTRLYAAIKSLAQDRKKISKLRDNYDDAVRSGEFDLEFNVDAPYRAYLPADLFDAKGPWVCVRGALPGPSGLAHMQAFNGRSPFLVFIRLPGDRSETLRYLRELNQFTAALHRTDDINEVRGWERRLPQFPVGTRLALVRKLTVLDTEGHIVVTPIVQTVQVRTYLRTGEYSHNESDSPPQATSKFVLRRQRLFSREAGGLELISDARDESVIVADGGASFISKFYGPAEDYFSEGHQQRLLDYGRGCIECHSCGGGTAASIFSFYPKDWLEEGGLLLPGDHGLWPARVTEQQRKAILWKMSQPSWRQLEKYWKSNAQP